MPRIFLAGLLLVACMPAPAAPADEARITYLEQEVRSLRRDLLTLSRQIEELQRQGRMPSSAGVTERGAERAPDENAEVPVWVDATRWEHVHPGDGELDVIRLLGQPTSMRDEGGAQVLFYALEIGKSGFLGGSVTLRDHVVIRVRVPRLQ